MTEEEVGLPWTDEEFINLFYRAVNSPEYYDSALATRDLVNEVVKRMKND